jgi:hypothetical protein
MVTPTFSAKAEPVISAARAAPRNICFIPNPPQNDSEDPIGHIGRNRPVPLPETAHMQKIYAIFLHTEYIFHYLCVVKRRHTKKNLGV